MRRSRRRREIVTDATRRATRLRDLLASVCPGLERIVDGTSKTGLHLLTRYVIPAEILSADQKRLLAHLRKLGHVKNTRLITLADAALAAARA